MKLHQLLLPWLQKKTRQGILGSILAALALLVMGLAVLFVTFWMVYIIIFPFSGIVRHSHETRLWVSGAVLVLLFLGEISSPRTYLEKIQLDTPSGRKPVTIYVPGVGMGSTINPLGPETMVTFTKIGAEVVRTGPRLVFGVFHFLGKANSLRNLDAEGCAAVLSLLARKGEKVPYEKIMEVIPPGHSLENILVGLRLLDGVLFLHVNPAGLKLTDDLQQEIGELKRNHQAIRT